MTLFKITIVLFAALAATTGVLALVVQIRDHLALKKMLRDIRRKARSSTGE